MVFLNMTNNTTKVRFAVISIFPEMFSALTQFGVIGRAVADKIIEVTLINPRDFTSDNYRRVDERPYGGGPGMVMMAEPLYQAILKAKEILGVDARVVYLSPQGKTFKQADAAQLLHYEKLILLCGRYEGVDQRLIDECVDMEISIGDFVVSGGEMPAMLMIDAMTRLLPGVLNDENSAKFETFQSDLVDYPNFTAPREWHGLRVPEVLLSGDHKEIQKWREFQATEKTRLKSK